MTTSTLSPLGETLLTPLYARAHAPDLLPELGFVDPHAVALIVRTQADTYNTLTDLSSVAGMVLRTMLYDRLTRQFAEAHPDAVVVSVGVGLCARNLRLGPQLRGVDWFGIDLPDVVDLRLELMPADEMPLVAASVGQPGFLRHIRHEDRPTLVLAEGVLPYLTPWEVRTFLRECATLPAGSQLVADVFHPMVATFSLHPISWATGAPMKSGAVSARDLAGQAPGLEVVDEFELFNQIGGAPWMWAAWTKAVTWGGRLYCVAQLRTTGLDTG